MANAIAMAVAMIQEAVQIEEAEQEAIKFVARLEVLWQLYPHQIEKEFGYGQVNVG